MNSGILRRTLICSLLLPIACPAHSDPRGDIHPVVNVEDGQFAISFDVAPMTFTSNPDEQPSRWRVLYTPDGKVSLPRHRVPEHSLDSEYHPDQTWVKAVRDSDNQTVRFAITRPVGAFLHEFPLPIDPTSSAWPEGSFVAGDWVGFTWGNQVTPEGSSSRFTPPTVELMFSAANIKDFTSGPTVKIGEPATIYHFPRCSSPLWAANHWWVAWVRAAPDSTKSEVPPRAWETVLTKIDPTTGEMNHRVLDGLSDWNTSLSINATNGWLCVAWHVTKDGTYPGIAKIETVFERLADESLENLREEKTIPSR